MSGVRIEQVGDLVTAIPPDGRNLTPSDIAEIFGPEAADPQRACGVYHERKIVYVFRCTICGNRVRNDQGMEPLCTGPGWTDDHPPEVMAREHGAR